MQWLYQAYEQWAKLHRIVDPISQKKFGELVKGIDMPFGEIYHRTGSFIKYEKMKFKDILQFEIETKPAD